MFLAYVHACMCVCLSKCLREDEWVSAAENTQTNTHTHTLIRQQQPKVERYLHKTEEEKKNTELMCPLGSGADDSFTNPPQPPPPPKPYIRSETHRDPLL